MGLAAQLRQAFLDAQHYAQEWAEYEKKKSEKADDKRILSRQSVFVLRRDNCVSDPIQPRDRNQLRFSVERVVHMHVRHDFVTKLNEIIGHLLGGNFRQAEVTFRINQAWVHSHSTHVLHASVSWNLHFRCRSHSGDFPVLYHQHTVFNGSMRDREQLAALEHNRLLRICAARENNADKNCHSEYG